MRLNNGKSRTQKYARELGAYDRVADSLSEGKPVYQQRGGKSVLYFAEQASNSARGRPVSLTFFSLCHTAVYKGIPGSFWVVSDARWPLVSFNDSPSHRFDKSRDI